MLLTSAPHTTVEELLGERVRVSRPGDQTDRRAKTAPGREERFMSMTFESADDLARALRRAAEAHGDEIAPEDPDWPSRYAQYIEREQAGPHSQRFAHLPERVDPSDMVASQQTEPPPDPEGGRDTDSDFMLRYGGAG
jgi:hypothetical protein